MYFSQTGKKEMNDGQVTPVSQDRSHNNSYVNIGVQINSDLAQYELNAKPWETMSHPLDRAPFCHRMTYLVTPGFMLYKEILASAIHVRGLTPPGMLGFLIPLRLGKKSSFWKKPPAVDALTTAMPGEFEAVIDPRQAHLIVLIDLCLLERLLPEDRVLALNHATVNHLLPASESAIWNLRQWLQYLLDRSQTEPGYFQHPAVLQALEEDVVRLFISTVDLPCYEKTRPALSKRRKGYNQVLEYLRNNDFAYLTIPAICQQVGISQRTLEYAFRDQLDITPLEFIRQLRLHSIRKSLSTSHSEETTVTDIAFEHGVNDMGRFANVYKQHFGELPSQTLKKPPIKPSSPYLRA